MPLQWMQLEQLTQPGAISIAVCPHPCKLHTWVGLSANVIGEAYLPRPSRGLVGGLSALSPPDTSGEPVLPAELHLLHTC